LIYGVNNVGTKEESEENVVTGVGRGEVYTGRGSY
jgi:hypothetical protein